MLHQVSHIGDGSIDIIGQLLAQCVGVTRSIVCRLGKVVPRVDFKLARVDLDNDCLRLCDEHHELLILGEEYAFDIRRLSILTLIILALVT